MHALISRRGFMAATTAAALSCALPGSMSGCSPSSNRVEDAEDGNTGGNATGADATSPAAQNPRFDPASFTVGDALGQTYQQALAKAQETAPDAALFALRTSHAIRPGEAAAWDYLFASQKELRYYIAFTGDVISVSELGKCTMKFAEWERVPAADAIKVDAAAAYETASSAAADSAMGQPAELYAYLILYSEEADTGAEAYTYVDEPMNWYFEFSFDSPESDMPSDQAAMAVWSVSAETGALARVVE